jgi:hypothetical protein
MILSFKAHLIDSLRFTKEIFSGDWIRGIVFLLLCLCFGFIVPVGVSERGIVHWIFIVFLYSVTVGYCIRIFRGSATPPLFAPAGILVKDGLIALMALWMLCIPSFICTVFNTITQSLTVWYFSAALLLIPTMMSPPIFFSYANTGKILESIRFSTIRSAIQTPGWGTYLKAWGIWVICFLALTYITVGFHFSVLHILPDGIAPPLNALHGFLTPIGFVFTSRFFTNVLMDRRDNETHHSGNPFPADSQEIPSGRNEGS